MIQIITALKVDLADGDLLLYKSSVKGPLLKPFSDLYFSTWTSVKQLGMNNC